VRDGDRRRYGEEKSMGRRSMTSWFSSRARSREKEEKNQKAKRREREGKGVFFGLRKKKKMLGASVLSWGKKPGL